MAIACECHYYGGAAQSVTPAGINTPIVLANLTQKVKDSNSGWSSSKHGFVVPSGCGGTYMIYGAIFCGGGNGSLASANILRTPNGSSSASIIGQGMQAFIGGVAFPAVQTLVTLSAGDLITLGVGNNGSVKFDAGMCIESFLGLFCVGA